MQHEVRFSDLGIHFEAYPFPGASVYPSGLLALGNIADIDPQDHPPSLRTRQGEVLFLPVACRQELVRWMARHGIPPYPHDLVHTRRAETFAPPPEEELMESGAGDEAEPPQDPQTLGEEDDEA